MQSSPTAEAWVFDVACATRALANDRACPVTPELVREAAHSLVRDRDDGTAVDDVFSHLAMSSVLLFPPNAELTARRAIYHMLTEHLPKELADMPFRLEGASNRQLLDVLALLEQSYGGQADMHAGEDMFGALLRRCELLERENRALHQQVERSMVDFGVRDVLASNSELVSALYHAIAVADSAKITAHTAAAAAHGGSDRPRLEDACVSCSLLGSAAVDDDGADGGSPRRTRTSAELADDDEADTPHRELLARVKQIESRWRESAASAETRALKAEQQVVALQRELLELKRSASLNLQPHQVVPADVAGATPLSRRRSEGTLQSSTPHQHNTAAPTAAAASSTAAKSIETQTDVGGARHFARLEEAAEQYAVERPAWEKEKLRLLQKLQAAAELLRDRDTATLIRNNGDELRQRGVAGSNGQRTRAAVPSSQQAQPQRRPATGRAAVSSSAAGVPGTLWR